MKANVGYNLEFKPKDACGDEKCPFHGSIAVRGKIFEGIVVSDSMDRTVKVEWENMVLDPKFSRYLKTKSSVLAHNPDCIKAKKGDKVKIGETRPISKRKHFAIVEVIKE
ncbi:MAG: 30S ribosomal protein S17 [Nanoarchaeota archaeon]